MPQDSWALVLPAKAIRKVGNAINLSKVTTTTVLRMHLPLGGRPYREAYVMLHMGRKLPRLRHRCEIKQLAGSNPAIIKS